MIYVIIITTSLFLYYIMINIETVFLYYIHHRYTQLKITMYIYYMRKTRVQGYMGFISYGLHLLRRCV